MIYGILKKLEEKYDRINLQNVFNPSQHSERQLEIYEEKLRTYRQYVCNKNSANTENQSLFCEKEMPSDNYKKVKKIRPIIAMTVAGILMASSVFASGAKTTATITMRYENPVEPTTLNQIAGYNVNYIEMLPANMPTEITSKEQADIINSNIQLPQELIDADVDVFIVTDYSKVQ